MLKEFVSFINAKLNDLIMKLEKEIYYISCDYSKKDNPFIGVYKVHCISRNVKLTYIYSFASDEVSYEEFVSIVRKLAIKFNIENENIMWSIVK
jgi:hypothetical protein